MRPGNTITGTQNSVLITGMQFKVNLRAAASDLELTVIGKTPAGKKHNRNWTRTSGVAAPTPAQINAAMLAIEAKAEADIVLMLS